MILFAALLLTGSAARVQAQCLTLEVRDIDRVQGFLYVAVYSSPDNFLKKLLTGFRVEVKDKTVIVPGPFPRLERKRDAGHGRFRHSPGADGFQQ